MTSTNPAVASSAALANLSKSVTVTQGTRQIALPGAAASNAAASVPTGAAAAAQAAVVAAAGQAKTAQTAKDNLYIVALPPDQLPNLDANSGRVVQYPSSGGMLTLVSSDGKAKAESGDRSGVTVTATPIDGSQQPPTVEKRNVAEILASLSGLVPEPQSKKPEGDVAPSVAVAKKSVPAVVGQTSGSPAETSKGVTVTAIKSQPVTATKSKPGSQSIPLTQQSPTTSGGGSGVTITATKSAAPPPPSTPSPAPSSRPAAPANNPAGSSGRIVRVLQGSSARAAAGGSAMLPLAVKSQPSPSAVGTTSPTMRSRKQILVTNKDQEEEETKPKEVEAKKKKEEGKKSGDNVPEKEEEETKVSIEDQDDLEEELEGADYISYTNTKKTKQQVKDKGRDADKSKVKDTGDDTSASKPSEEAEEEEKEKPVTRGSAKKLS